MSVQVMITCGCKAEDPHYSFELGSDFSEIWFDNLHILNKLGIANLPSLGEIDEEESNEDFLLARIEPRPFLDWLDKIAVHRSSISAAFKTAGQSGRWKDQHFWSVEPGLRELAQHCLDENTHVEVSHG
jgi:hypothetical protein